MNTRILRKVWNLAATISEASDEMYKLSQATKKATKSISKLPMLVKAAKEKHGLTWR